MSTTTRPTGWARDLIAEGTVPDGQPQVLIAGTGEEALNAVLDYIRFAGLDVEVELLGHTGAVAVRGQSALYVGRAFRDAGWRVEGLLLLGRDR